MTKENTRMGKEKIIEEKKMSEEKTRMKEKEKENV